MTDRVLSLLANASLAAIVAGTCFTVAMGAQAQISSPSRSGVIGPVPGTANHNDMANWNPGLGWQIGAGLHRRSNRGAAKRTGGAARISRRREVHARSGSFFAQAGYQFAVAPANIRRNGAEGIFGIHFTW